MTPEERAHKLLQTAWFIDKNHYDLGVRETAETIRDATREAIEQAAKVAEGFAPNADGPKPVARYRQSHKIAAAIRTLITEEK